MNLVLKTRAFLILFPWDFILPFLYFFKIRIALRVRNSTHNFVYAESFGSGAIAKPTFSGSGRGVYECQEGDLCQTELYNYGEVSASVFSQFQTIQAHYS